MLACISVLGGKVSRTILLASALVLPLGVVARAEPASTADKYQIGLTLPTDGHARELKFESQGTIKSVEVKPGDHVKAGQVLMRQDDRKEVAELEGLKADANNIGIEQAEIQRIKAKADVDRLEKLATENRIDAEMDKAKAELQYYVEQIKKEQFDLEVKKHKIDRQAAVVDMMQLRSPIDGFVQQIDSLAGETADPQKPAIRIVSNDPLQVQLVLTTAMTQKLKLGTKMRVSYDRKAWIDAQVSYIAPQALGVGTHTIWLQMANPENRQSGMQVTVELPDDVAAAQELAVGSDAIEPAGTKNESASTGK